MFHNFIVFSSTRRGLSCLLLVFYQVLISILISTCRFSMRLLSKDVLLPFVKICIDILSSYRRVAKPLLAK